MTRIPIAPVGEEHEHEFITNHRAQSGKRSQTHPTTSPLPYPPHILTSLTLLKPHGTTHTHIIPPKHGHAFLVKAGASFRIIDLHGAQVIDLMAWTSPGNRTGQHSSMSYTRYNIAGCAPPEVGECIYTNLGQQMLRLTADTVKTHDLLYMACNPSFYAARGRAGHPNCAENIAGAVTRQRLGHIGWNDVVDPFNVFQNTPYYSLKALGSSKAGDHCEFENVLGVDVVVGLSCCPFEEAGFNGGKVTEVAVVTEADR